MLVSALEKRVRYHAQLLGNACRALRSGPVSLRVAPQLHTHTYTYTHTDPCTHTHVYIHTCTHTHTRAHTPPHQPEPQLSDHRMIKPGPEIVQMLERVKTSQLKGSEMG